MYCDIVLMDGNAEIVNFARRLGFSKIIFKEDFAKLGIIEARDYSYNRNLIETKKVKVLVNPQVNTLKDRLHYRSSGLDQILCTLANKNNIAIGFSFNTLDNPVLIGRLKQNIRLCRKYKVKMLFFYFAENKYRLRSVNDLLSLLRVLGMTGKEAKIALNGL